MKFKITKIASSVSCVLGVLTLMMGSVGVQAAVSSPTDTIEGRVPTAEGTLFVADQTGATVGTTPENSIVDREHTPNSFKASTDTTDLTLLDVDGDCDLPRGPCTAAVDVASTTKVWKYEGNVITPTQLTSPFKTYFAGKALTVTVTAPVATTTTTGAPIVGTNPLSSEETTVVVPVVPGIYVGQYRWDAEKLFPTTAALDMKFTISIDGNNAAQTDYSWVTNQPSWISVTDGIVTITAAPTSATKTVTITATNKINPLLKTVYTFTVNKWFETVRILSETSFSPSASSLFNTKCTTGKGARTAALVSDAAGPGPAASYRRVPGGFFAEWGLGQHPTGWAVRGDGYPEVLVYIDTLEGVEISPNYPGVAVAGGANAAAVSWQVISGLNGVVSDIDGFTKIYPRQGNTLATDVLCVKDI